MTRENIQDWQQIYITSIRKPFYVKNVKELDEDTAPLERASTNNIIVKC